MKNLALVWVLAGVAVALLAAGDGKPSISTFTDKRDGKVYRIVQIGRQVWFAENLNFAAEGSKCYENSEDSCAKYGRLYDWATAMTACPTGTHLPNDAEWKTLENFVGGSKTAGKKLKSTSGWYNNGNGTDEYGFSALPGGSGNSDGNFYYAGGSGYWWSATTGYYTWFRYMSYSIENVYRSDFKKTALFSVRCVAD